MKNIDSKIQNLIKNLQERSKELTCLYKVEEILNKKELSLPQIFEKLVRIIPWGWQYPEFAQVKIQYNDQVYKSPKYEDNTPKQEVLLKTQEKTVGKITVNYKSTLRKSDKNLFLEEELKLLKSIADRIGFIIMHKELKEFYSEWDKAEKKLYQSSADEWKIILNMLKRSDKNLYITVSRKMLHFLSRQNIKEANELLTELSDNQWSENIDNTGYINRPLKKQELDYFIKFGDKIFEIASKNLNSKKIMKNVEKSIDEEKVIFLTRVVEQQNSSMDKIIDALNRFQHMGMKESGIPEALKKGMRVSLVRRFFTDQIEFIRIAKKHIYIESYFELIRTIIFPENSYGKLGGKSAGLFLAKQIIEKYSSDNPLLSTIKTPKTWYITSDGLINFIYYNNLENIMEQKYKSIDEISMEYPNIIQIFKNSHFPQEIIKGLKMVIEEFGDNPIIVRSSSLLEDSIGSSFSGKYKSLFLANQGTKEEKLEALKDAVAEVYASVFDANPIEYRSERGLLDLHEEMGIMIQEVVGKRVGHYFIPSFSGVAFSNNEFRWSPRIKREDGLIRLVPGLGTRAVDRMANDYPILIAPGKPNLKVNVTPDEVLKYTPNQIDVINLKTNTFQTIEIKELLEKHGHKIPNIENMISKFEQGNIQPILNKFNLDFKTNNNIITFEGLIKRTDFIKQVDTLLHILSDELNTPVDIEFAHDGQNFYLLQCRPQSFSEESLPGPIPQDLSKKDILFTANRYISNGLITNLTHLVYINPESYNKIDNLDDLKNVGRVVGKLNKILPKRQFILIGPGRWGSRGDIKLGVSVKYSDINNTAALIEVAFKKGNYTPELSFGTHFFQDLVESNIRYLPLYPDEEDVVYNSNFFTHSENILPDLLHEYKHLSETIKVIDIQKNKDNKILNISMNADLDTAIGYFSEKSDVKKQTKKQGKYVQKLSSENYWKWRKNVAEKIALKINPEEYGIKAVYLIGSVKNATAGPGSDIDLLIHHQGNKKQLQKLKLWLDGWSKCLAEINKQRTGYKCDGLLDLHFITDQDIKNKTSFATKINAITDPARPLPIGKSKKK